MNKDLKLIIQGSKVNRIPETPEWVSELKEFLTIRNIIGLAWLLIDVIIITLLIVRGV